MVCWCWSARQRQRRGGIAKPLWRPFWWPYEPAYLPETWGTLLYPLQLLTNDVLLATLLGMSATIQLWAVTDRGPSPAASIPSVSEMPVPQAGAKHQCHSLDQGLPTLRQEEEEMTDIDDIPKEHPHHKRKEGKPAVKALKEPYWEASSKELGVVKVARQAYKAPPAQLPAGGVVWPLLQFSANGHLH